MLIADDDIKGKPTDELQAQAQAQNADSAAAVPPAAPPSYQASLQPQSVQQPQQQLQQQRPQQPVASSSSSSQHTPILPLHNSHNRPVSYGSTGPSSFKEQRDARRKAQKRAMRRFIKAALVAVGIWLLFSVFVRTFVEMVRHSSSSHLPDNGSDQDHTNYPPIEPVPSDVTRDRCLKTPDFQATTAHNELQAIFHIPLDDSLESLVLLSRGYLSRGYTTIQQATQESASADARVEVRMVYDENHKDLLDDVEVCSLQRGGSSSGRYGVGVFSPSRYPNRHLPDQRYFPTFFITLHIPAGRTFLKKLETDVANHSQLMLIPPPTDDNSGLVFGALDLRNSNGAVSGENARFLGGSITASNGPILLKNVECNGCNVHTTNGQIRGTYHAKNTLVLKTTNAAVDVNVLLGHDELESSAASAFIQTTNENFRGNVTLLGKTNESRPSQYTVTSSTTNARSELSIPIMPMHSALSVYATTSNGRSLITLPNEFEGSFHATTTNAKAELIGLQKPDPEGRGRDEQLHFVRGTSHGIQGDRRWGASHGKGNLLASTTNGPVTVMI